ncbi:MAG: PorV/PorQ family protein [candidate division Zixibacteria bacterium]|nr:PorV/PorQ family protein [candidate division Zixibacteria bacterium]
MKSLSRAWLLLGMALFILCQISLAGDAGRESQFSLGSGARALGMGGGFVGLADDASAVYWNQAALPLLDIQELSLMHVTLFEGSIFDVATFVYPDPKQGGFGVSFMRLGTGDIIRRQDWNAMGDFSYSTWQMLLGYGRKINDRHSLGGALKIVSQSLDNNAAYGIGLDLSFLSNIKKNISAGIIFQDIIAPHLRLDKAQEATPTTIVAGIGLKDIVWGMDFRHKINMGLEKTRDRSLKLHAGAESIYRDHLALRAGYDRDNVTLGFGVYYHRFRFDYAYKFVDELTDSHRLGLSFQMGTPVSEKIRQEQEFESARGNSLILEDRKAQFRLYRDMAEKYYRTSSLDSAYAYYQRALAFNEGDADVKGRIRQLTESRQMMIEEAHRESSRKVLALPIFEGYYAQAEMFYKKGSYAASLDLVNSSLGIAPDDQRFINLKNKIIESRDGEISRLMDEAMKYDKETRYADAITSYNRIMELSPGNAAVKQMISRTGTEINNSQLISRGAESFAMGNLSDAKRRFEEVMKSDPTNLVATEYMGKISALMKEASELEDLQKDEKVWKIYLLALEHFRNGDYQTAIKLWNDVLKYYPGNRNAMNNIEQAKLRLEAKK